MTPNAAALARDYLRDLPAAKKGELPVIPVDERAAVDTLSPVNASAPWVWIAMHVVEAAWPMIRPARR